MPWFKVDDTLHSHPKPRKAGLARDRPLGARRLLLHGLQDRRLRARLVRRRVAERRKLADSLVKAGQWEIGEKDGEAGWFFHDWFDYQPSSTRSRPTASTPATDNEAPREAPRRPHPRR
jgi:hypothetical protein